ncbi:hypothetical protein [Paracoccus niistensis]|uniref:DUF4386 family protein n=1 Tax=Paracoccus niistensis TaxID=632935 RepID=A0ABV6I0N5_9RHOB
MNENRSNQGGFTARAIGLGLLSGCAAFQVGMGIYFIALRPTLLPEDERFIGGSLAELSSAAPELAIWLNRVFVVLGGHAVATGLLAFLAVHLVSRRGRPSRVALLLLAGAGLFSTVLMSRINFAIASDFRWVLLVPALAWIAGVITLGLRAFSLRPGQE